jgi:nicotinate-nucleotide adenylyltransferase
VHIGILGGTFDPIHFGHLAVGEAALAYGELDRVLMVPAGDPWQRAGRTVTPAVHRLEMVRLGVQDRPGLEVDDREVRRTGPTYTIDTLESFPATDRLSLILGVDSAMGIRSWHRWQEVVGRAGVLVVPRPGFTAAEVAEVLPHARSLEMEPVSINATTIRRRIRDGESVADLVPFLVIEYIAANHLYAKPDEDDMVVAPSDMEEPS